MRLSEMPVVPAPEWAAKHPEARAYAPTNNDTAEWYLSQYGAFPTLFHWQYRTNVRATDSWMPYGEPFTLREPKQ